MNEIIAVNEKIRAAVGNRFSDDEALVVDRAKPRVADIKLSQRESRPTFKR